MTKTATIIPTASSQRRYCMYHTKDDWISNCQLLSCAPPGNCAALSRTGRSWDEYWSTLKWYTGGHKVDRSGWPNTSHEDMGRCSIHAIVHNDMKSHTGGAVSFRTGVHSGKPNKQRLNIKSSTKAELVGASNYLPHTNCSRKLMERQGYAIIYNTFYN